MPKVALYDKLLDKSKKAIEALKQPLLRKADRQRFISAVNNESLALVDLKNEQLAEYEKLGKLDPQKIYSIQLKIDKHENAIKTIKHHFQVLWGEEMPENV